MAKVLKILFLLLLIAALLVVGAVYFLKGKVDDTLTPGGFVELIEGRYNCRAQIATVESDLVASLSQIRVGTLLLAPRDSHAELATPLAERPVIAEGDAVLAVDHIEIQANLRDLAKGRFSFKELLLRGLRADVLIDAEGENNLAPLFEVPAVVGGEPNPEYEEPGTAGAPRVPGGGRAQLAAVGGTETGAGGEGEAEEDSGVEAGDIPLPATMERAAIEDGQIVLRHAGSGTLSKFADLRLELTNIDVDSRDLALHNHLDLSLAMRLLGIDAASGETFMEFVITGEGDAGPFDPTTGELNPAATADLVVAQGSYVEGRILSRLGSVLEMASEYGLDVLDLTGRAPLGEDVKTRVKYFDSVLTFEEDLLLPLGRYLLGFKYGGWINTAENTHDMHGVVIASPEVTEKALGEVRDYLKEKLGGTLADLALNTVSAPLLNEENCLTLDFHSTESFSDPNVTLDTPLGELGDSIQEIGKKLLKDSGGLKGLLKGLLE